MIYKSYRYRIYPNKLQQVLINKHIGGSRFLYNIALECKQMAYIGNGVNLSAFDLIKQLPELKIQCEWLKELNSQSLQQPIINLDAAFTSFFKGQRGFPSFKKKLNSGTFTIPQNIFIKNNKLVIPKFQEGIPIVLHRDIIGKVKRARITKTATGKYFASIVCEMPEPSKKPQITKLSTIGIDLGIKNFVITSDGKEYDNPKFLRKAQSKLKYIQRKASKHKGKRTKQKLALLHEKVTNQRKDFLHKTSSEIVKNHDTIAIEKLQVSNMLKNHKLALSISDAGWYSFTEMLRYKAEWKGKNILTIGTFEPSSKTCSCCGNVNKELTLKDREWTCNSCNTTHDRDVNAAINIKNFALRKLCTGHTLKNQNELPTMVGVLTSEAQIN